MTKRNDFIDLLKFLFSIMVIGIHTHLFELINSTLYYATSLGVFRLSVPFFFICSGYFFYKKIEDKRDTSSYLKKLLKIYFTFEVIELLLYTVPLLYGGMTVPVLIRRFFTVGIGGIYWYLISLIITLMILRPLWKKGIIIPGTIIGLILYLFMMTNDSYSVLFNGTMIQKYAIMHTNFWTWPQAGLCSSMLFLSIGALLKKHDINPPLIFVILSIVILIVESLFTQAMKPQDANGYLALIIGAPLLFSYALHHPLSTKYRYFGELSLYIYMIHPFFVSILGVFVDLKSWRFLVVAICTITLSYLIVRRQHKERQTIK